MRFSSIFSVEIKRLLPLLFLVVFSLSTAFAVSQFSTPHSFNVIIAIDYSSSGIKITGYGFNSHGQGVPYNVSIDVSSRVAPIPIINPIPLNSSKARSNLLSSNISAQIIFPNGTVEEILVTNISALFQFLGSSFLGSSPVNTTIPIGNGTISNNGIITHPNNALPLSLFTNPLHTLMEKNVVTNNGTFSSFVPISPSSYEILSPINISINIYSLYQNHVVHYPLYVYYPIHDSKNPFDQHFISSNQTFAFSHENFTAIGKVSGAYQIYNTSNISIITVDGGSVIVKSPSVKYVCINGEKVFTNSTIFFVPSYNVKPPHDEVNNLGYSVIKENMFYLLALEVIIMGSISIFAYFNLSQFPRHQMDLIFRVLGVSKVYITRLISMLIFVFLLSFPSLAIFMILTGIFLSSAIPYLVVPIMYFLALYGISTLVSSKELVYLSVIVASYLLNLIFFNMAFLSIVALALPLIGFIKLWWRYR